MVSKNQNSILVAQAPKADFDCYRAADIMYMIITRIIIITIIIIVAGPPMETRATCKKDEDCRLLLYILMSHYTQFVFYTTCFSTSCQNLVVINLHLPLLYKLFLE